MTWWAGFPSYILLQRFIFVDDGKMGCLLEWDGMGSGLVSILLLAGCTYSGSMNDLKYLELFDFSFV
jgi:hypothetical protein